jgi:hypothetical protein
VRVRQLSILVLVGLTLVAACGSSTSSAKSGSTTSRTVNTSNPKGSGATTTTKPKTSFATGFPEMQQTLAAAKGDACKLYAFSNVLNSVENPATTAENKEAVGILAQYFMDIADVLAPDHPTEADSLRTETTKFTQQAQAANYNLDDPSLSALNDQPFQQAFATFQQETSSCSTPTTAG